MSTAYNYPQALHVDRAEIDILLVGDSLGMVELGYSTTQPVTMDEMLHHAKAVSRGCEKSLMVGDLPFGSYEICDEEAVRNAHRFVKESSMDCVKLEGGGGRRRETVRRIVESGVAVMGHIGLTPQAISVIGGFRAQGRTARKARDLLDEALGLQDAGAFAIVLECVPDVVGKAITEALEIPTIGIGAGRHTNGQVLVYHDMLGLMSHPHHQQFVPKFCKQYASLGDGVGDGLMKFRQEVEKGEFPSEEYSPYSMSAEEEQRFKALLMEDAKEREKNAKVKEKDLREKDEYDVLNLYGSGSGSGSGNGSGNGNGSGSESGN